MFYPEDGNSRFLRKVGKFFRWDDATF